MANELYNMEITRCPYDSTEISVENIGEDTYNLSCSHCGAKWETKSALVTRIAEPDWQIIEEFQSV